MTNKKMLPSNDIPHADLAVTLKLCCLVYGEAFKLGLLSKHIRHPSSYIKSKIKKKKFFFKTKKCVPEALFIGQTVWHDVKQWWWLKLGSTPSVLKGPTREAGESKGSHEETDLVQLQHFQSKYNFFYETWLTLTYMGTTMLLTS